MTSLHARRQRRPASEPQHELVSAMLEPGFYRRRPSQVTHKETHISHVFLTDDLVYKIKKPVRFSFLDYSTLSKRRYYLNEELRLNRRLAPSVYLAVMPISFDCGWRLGGWGAPVEYALVMRRLPERRMLPFLLESGQLTPEMMRSLAETVAPFHAQAEPVHKTHAVQYPWTLHKEWAENLSDLEPFLGTLIADDAFAALKKFGANFIANHHDLSVACMRAGFGTCMATSTASTFVSRPKEFRSSTASNSARNCVAATRKTSAGKLGRHIAAFNEGLYNPDMYTRMMREAEKQTLDGKGAILDATFGHKRHRDRAARLAAKHKLPRLMIRCYASDEITKQRLDRRLSGGKDLSDGRWEIYLAQKAAVQPIEELPTNSCLELDTNPPAEQLVRASERFVRSRLVKI